MFQQPKFKRELSSGESIYGILNSVPDVTIAEMLVVAGYDFVVLDMEHLPHNEANLYQLIQVISAKGASALVRLSSQDDEKVGRILDMGAAGIVVSRAEDVEQIKKISEAIFFPPKGRRGITGGKNTGYGSLKLAEYIALANEELMLVPMIETVAGVDVIENILTVPGVNMIMEGALDLALDMKLGPSPTDPRVLQTLHTVSEKCADHSIPYCANPRNEEQMNFWRNKGIKAYFCGEDRGLMYRSLLSRLNTFKEILG